jgi:predicted Fe-Mo cluster-binding NifX family protein
MKLGMPIWEGRLSPVFDAALRLLCVDLVDGAESGRSESALPPGGPAARVDGLLRLGVDILICGAISRPLAGMIASGGVTVIPFISGTPDEVITAFLNGTIQTGPFHMPGCCGRGRGLRAGRGGQGGRSGHGWRGGCS